MKLYLINQDVNNGYDTYDSAVVAAKNEGEARLIRPADWGGDSVWTTPENVKVKLIGIAVKDTKQGVILASFNAG